MNALYVVEKETDECIVTFYGETNEDCEHQANDKHADTDVYYWSYTMPEKWSENYQLFGDADE